MKTTDDDTVDLFAAFAEANDNERVQELMRLIRYHRDLYYNGDPEIEDDEFDALVDELRELDSENEVLFEVGAPVADDSNWEKATHKIAMTSLDKVNTVEEMRDWMKKRYAKWVCVQEKLDGGSLSADYENGKLVRVVTRGRGAEGEVITRNAVKFKGVKQTLPTNFTGSLRGEVMFFLKYFDAYNEEAAKRGWTVFKNMRNGANGLARRTNGDGVEHLIVLFYEIEGKDFDSEFEKMNYIRKMLGLWTPWYARVQADGLERVYREYSDTKRAKLFYEIDGLVIKVDSTSDAQDIEDALQVSSRDTANPKSQVAWKFANETRVSTIVNVAADFGLGGRITPVAEVNPVKFTGVTVERASIHNWPMVKDLNIRVGGKVLLARANDVIPQVVRMLDDVGTLAVPPTHCPKCGSELVEDGKFLFCRNDDCPGVVAGRIRNWIQKLGIKHFGMTDMIEPLVAQGILKDISDLYKLDENAISPIVGKGRAKRGLANLNGKRAIELPMLLGSIGIPNFGRSLARDLVAGGYNTLDKALGATVGQMAALPGYGTGRATAVYNGLRANETLLRDLAATLVIQAPKAAASDGPLKGSTFCITGKLSQPKKVYETMILDNGGGYETSLKSSVTHLIAADASGNSSKLQAARKKGVQIIDEAGLKALLAG